MLRCAGFLAGRGVPRTCPVAFCGRAPCGGFWLRARPAWFLRLSSCTVCVCLMPHAAGDVCVSCVRRAGVCLVTWAAQGARGGAHGSSSSAPTTTHPTTQCSVRTDNAMQPSLACEQQAAQAKEARLCAGQETPVCAPAAMQQPPTNNTCSYHSRANNKLRRPKKQGCVLVRRPQCVRPPCNNHQPTTTYTRLRRSNTRAHMHSCALHSAKQRQHLLLKPRPAVPPPGQPAPAQARPSGCQTSCCSG